MTPKMSPEAVAAVMSALKAQAEMAERMMAVTVGQTQAKFAAQMAATQSAMQAFAFA